MYDMQEEVAIITLNWNNWQDSEKLLVSVLNLDYQRFRLFFVDNGSTDGSVERLEDFLINNKVQYSKIDTNTVYKGDCKVYIVQNYENLGYTGGINSALRIVFNTDNFKYIWILNNDTILEKNTLNLIIECFNRYKQKGLRVGAVGTKMLHFDMTLQTFCGSKIFKLLGNSVFVDKHTDIDYISGASLFAEVDTLKEIGLFDERFFLYWDDADLGIRFKKAGYMLLCCSEAVVYHKEGGTAGRINQLNDYYWVRNGLLFTKKHYPYLLPIVILSYIFKYAILRTFRRQPNNLNSLFSGIVDFFMGKFGKKV